MARILLINTNHTQYSIYIALSARTYRRASSADDKAGFLALSSQTLKIDKNLEIWPTFTILVNVNVKLVTLKNHFLLGCRGVNNNKLRIKQKQSTTEK